MEVLIFAFVVVTVTVLVVATRLPTYRAPKDDQPVESETVREDDRLAG